MSTGDGIARSLDTARLALRPFTLGDAPFILELQSDPAWLRFIGDRGVHDLDSAREYLRKVPLQMYRSLGFGPLRMDLKDGSAIGMCGLFKREVLEDVDLGFALLSRHRGSGYAAEAAAAVLAWGREVLGLRRVAAITAPDNAASGRVLERVGMRFERMLPLPGDAGGVKLYVVDFA